MNLEAASCINGLDFLNQPALKAARHAVNANKKLVLEYPIHKNFKPPHKKRNNWYWSFPNIPTRGVNPWEYIDLYKNLPYKPWLHLRTRDFANICSIDNFLNQSGVTPQDAEILVLYGDGDKPGGIRPIEVIPHLKSLGYTTGCVFNPTPVIRTQEEEFKSFQDKLTADPDFMVSQTTYNIQALDLFCREIPDSIEAIVSLGYWNAKTNFNRLGINTLDENGEKHYAPNNKFLNALWEQIKPEGIYICDYSSGHK